MSSGGGSNTVQKADPWSGVAPYLRGLYEAANQSTFIPKQFYPNTTVAPWSGTTLTANNKIYNRAMSGSPLLGDAQGQASDTLAGDYLNNPTTQGLLGLTQGDNTKALRDAASGGFLNSNPYVDDMFGQAADRVGQQFRKNVMPGVYSAFSGAGRYGSNQMNEAASTAQQNYGDTLRKLATDVYGTNYANERQLMQQASGQLGTLELGGLGTVGEQFGRERALMGLMSGQAPALAEADYGDLGKLEALGQKEEANHQARINEAIARWDFGQNEYDKRLATYNSILQGTAGVGGTTTTSGGGNWMTGALGGAMLGSSAAGLLGGGTGAVLGSAGSGVVSGAATGSSLGPWGALAGAILGGLMSR